MNCLKTTLGLVAVAVGMLALESFARPAFPGLIESKQPDGSVIRIRHVGNEYAHFTVTEDSLLIARDSAGYWSYADETGKPTKVRAHAKDKRQKLETDFLTGRDSKKILERHKALKKPRPASSSSRSVLMRPGDVSSSSAAGVYAAVAQPKYTRSLTTGDIHGLVVMVEFSDVHFMNENSQDLYDRFMNEQGFSDYANVGSVRDYFIQNSDSVFRPSFDVVGPVRVSGTRDYYGNMATEADMSVGARAALDEALNTVIGWGTIDFSKYDNDGDGNVDFVYMIYAGVGAADSDVKSAIWPHASYLRKKVATGMYVYKYACSNEISGTAFAYNNSTKSIDGIGAFTHEFSHVLGLMDTYDIYYSDANYFTPGTWDLMDAGTYNCPTNRYYVYSCSPPYLNAFERYSLGWQVPRTLSESDEEQELFDVTQNDGLVLPSKNPNEYYFLDYRMQKGFDAGLPMHGMLVWHITYDKTAWSKNELNVSDLQRVDLIEADGKGNQPSRWGYKQGTYEGDPFPGNERKTSINNFALWSGDSLGVSLSEITETDSSVKFKIAYSSGSLVFLSSSSEALSSSSEVLYSSNSVVESSSSVGLESSSSAEEPSTSSSESFDLVRKNIYGEPELNVLSRERFYDLKGRRVSAPKNH